MQVLHTENHKTSLKEIKDDLNSEVYHVHGSKDSIIVKISILPKLIYRFSEIPMKVTGGCFGYYVDSNIDGHAKAEGHSVSNIKN